MKSRAIDGVSADLPELGDIIQFLKRLEEEAEELISEYELTEDGASAMPVGVPPRKKRRNRDR